MTNQTFQISGLSCEACVKLVTNRFTKVPGVLEVKIDLTSGQAQVFSEAKLDPTLLAQSLSDTHYSIVN
jgi:copper chaperone CopZ